MTGEFTGWRKSSRCEGGACIQVGLKLTRWRKPRRSAGNGACLEAGTGDGVVGVRDSRLAGSSPVLAFPAEAWQAFADAVKRDAATC